MTATARRHPHLAPQLTALAATTRAHKRVLVHGDFSPKNILQGASGPVILDAECAWFGDPAFDVAFVLNHLLLKGAWQPQWRARYVDFFRALRARAIFAHVHWEPAAALARARSRALLPGLMLARVDGKSPVEYLARAETQGRSAQIRRRADRRAGREIRRRSHNAGRTLHCDERRLAKARCSPRGQRSGVSPSVGAQ